MSEPTTYYRLACDSPWHEEPEFDDGDLMHYGECFVPVEPCEHGNIDGHDTEYNPLKGRALDGHWCPGAGNGDNDAEKGLYDRGYSHRPWLEGNGVNDE